MTDVTLDLIQLYACPICSEARLDEVYRSDGVVYSQCPRCEITFLNPRMTDEQTRRYYCGLYRDLLGGENGVKQADIRTQQQRAIKQIDMIGHLLQGKRALEIGSSAGFLLYELARCSMDCVGIEPDRRYHGLPASQRFDVRADLDDLPPQPFDVIAMSHVLEHLNHPVSYLQRLHKDYARSGTRLVVEVPWVGKCYTHLIHHPFAFTPQTLEMVCSRAGWRRIYAGAHGLGSPNPMYILDVYERLP